MSFDLSRAIVIVTGAHPRAEAFDRPTAYRLRDQLAAWLGDHGMEPGPSELVVCSDVWYLNADDLRDRPVVSIGGPGVNALTAFLADKLPSVLCVTGQYTIQAEPDFERAVAACWGMEPSQTAAAASMFAARYLDAFLSSAVTA